MKSRLSYLLISGIIIISIFIGIFIWRNHIDKGIHKLNQTSFSAPISSQYIPTNADLVFHWKINPNILPSYISNYQEKVNKKITNKNIKFIRDSSFKLISLDFANDISKWVGENGSFAIFNDNKDLINEWLLVLSINKDINIEEEIESIVSPIINDTISNSRKEDSQSKTKIIPKRINANQSIYFSKNKDHILISSNPRIIKSSLNQIENNTLSTKEKYKDTKLKDNIKDGILLLEMSPKNIFKLTGQKKDILEFNQANKLLSSINLNNNDLILEGILAYDIKNKTEINNFIDNSFEIKEQELQRFEDLILIHNPKQYFGTNSRHPYQELIASVIKQSTTDDYSNLLKIILKNTKGNLVWLKNNYWLIITNSLDTNRKNIIDIFKKEKFYNSEIEFQDKNLEVWSKITTQNNENYEIKENIEAIIEEDEGQYIWSQNLSSISNLNHKKYFLKNMESAQMNEEINDFNDLIRIHLGEEKTEDFLNSFYPYILFRTMLGNRLNSPHQLDISIAIPKINYPDFIKFKINISTS